MGTGSIAEEAEGAEAVSRGGRRGAQIAEVEAPLAAAGSPEKMELVTKRTTLRPVVADDVAALHSLWTDPAVRKYLWDDTIVTLRARGASGGRKRRRLRRTGTRIVGGARDGNRRLDRILRLPVGRERRRAAIRDLATLLGTGTDD
jgi:hypothetical protein